MSDLNFMLILKIFYFAMPIYFANMAPVLFSKTLIFLNKPIDFNKKLGKNQLFGETKTIRGLITGVFLGMFIAFIQKLLFSYTDFFKELSLIDYSNIPILLFGFLMSFGAIFGDLFESFIKRRLNIKSQKPFVPFDQIDSIFGAILLCYYYLPIPSYWLIIFLITPILHFLCNVISYHLGLKEVYW